MATENTTYTLADFAALLHRRSWYFATLIPGTILLTVFLAYWLPPTYRASATLMLEPSSIPQDLIKTTVVSYAGEQIELVRGRVMASDKLIDLIKRIDPYPKMKDASVAEKARRIVEDTELEKVDPVTLKPLEDSTAFTIHYDNPDPYLAAVIDKELASLFVTYNRQARSETAEETAQFLQAQSAELTEQIRQMEFKLAAFKNKFGGALPGDQTYNQNELDRTRRDLDDLEQKIRGGEQREQQLVSQLSQMSPSLIGLAPDGRNQLALLKAQLAEALQRYTPSHPDVKRLQQQIATLTASGTASVAANTVPDNPAYLEAKTELEGVRNDLAAFKVRAERARADIRSFDARLRVGPSVEREYTDLLRDHETAQRHLTEIQTKLGQAQIAEKVESQQRGERITMIRPPVSPRTTHKPNRLGLILLGSLLAIALGVGAAGLADATDPTVRSARDLLEVTTLQAVGAIPLVITPKDRTKRFFAVGFAAAAFALALVLVGATLLAATSRERDAQERAAVQLRTAS